MKRYTLTRTTAGRAVVVVREGESRRMLRHIERHSPTGFEWGYGGSGPADLALALVADVYGTEDAHPNEYHRVKDLILSVIPEGGAIIDEERIRGIVDHVRQAKYDRERREDMEAEAREDGRRREEIYRRPLPGGGEDA